MEELKSIYDVERYMRLVSGSTILCSITLKEFKLYMALKQKEFFVSLDRKLYKAATYIGLQPDGSIVFSDKVWYCFISTFSNTGKLYIGNMNKGINVTMSETCQTLKYLVSDGTSCTYRSGDQASVRYQQVTQSREYVTVSLPVILVQSCS